MKRQEKPLVPRASTSFSEAQVNWLHETLMAMLTKTGDIDPVDTLPKRDIALAISQKVLAMRKAMRADVANREAERAALIRERQSQSPEIGVGGE